mgnify:CR=1 FL=1
MYVCMFRRWNSVQYNFLSKKKKEKNGVTLQDTELCFADAGECYIRKILAISLLLHFSHIYSIRTRIVPLDMSILPPCTTCTSLSTIDQYSRLRFFSIIQPLQTIHRFIPSTFDVSFVKILFSRQHVLINFPPPMRIA